MWTGLTKRLFSTNNKNILVSLHDKVALIRLNRPSALNSLNSELMNELGQALVEVENNNALSCAIITGDTKSFAGD
jgi:enoyl-CoA hydratase/carnithine racemase